MSDSLRPHESQHARPPCPLPTPGVHSDSRPLSPWCHPAISSSVIPFSSCPQSLPASESFPMSQLFTWGGQSIGVSALASFLPKNTQGWSKCNLQDAHNLNHTADEAWLEGLLTFASRRLCWRPHGLYETQQVTNEWILWKKNRTKIVSSWISA